MLLDIEDLPDERNGRACGDRAHGMQRNGEASEPVSCCRPAQVKDGDHDHDKSVASAGAYLVPMGGDKQHYSACQQDGAKNQRDSSLPAQPSGTLRRVAVPLRLEGADATGHFRVEDTGGLPSV